jgi:hypothetical protein
MYNWAKTAAAESLETIRLQQVAQPILAWPNPTEITILQ